MPRHLFQSTTPHISSSGTLHENFRRGVQLIASEEAEMIGQTKLEKHNLAIAQLCRNFGVRELSVFGSVAIGKGRPASDVDLLIEFGPGTRVGLLTLAQLQREFESILGCKVDLVPKGGLKPLIRDEILAAARVVYAA